jgi:hypothetical protein
MPILRQKVETLRAGLKPADPARLATVLADLQDAVRRHFHHEDIFYRILDNDKRVGDRGAMHQVRNDHAAIVFGLESLAIRLRKNGPGTEWQGKLQNLLNVLLPHFEQEEKKLFPDALKLLTPAEVETIQNELARDE